MAKLDWRTVVSPIFGQNAFIVREESTNECVLVDPGIDMESVFDLIAEEQWEMVGLLNTHGHADHIAGNEAAKARWPNAPLLIGHGDENMLADANANLSAMFGMALVSPAADRLVNEKEVAHLAGVDWHVLETPGHSPGHVVYVCKDSDPWLVLGGDMLFRLGIGRTDFPGGDSIAMGKSIRDKLYQLPDDTIVLPGHGEPTTIGFEKANNPFVDSL